MVSGSRMHRVLPAHEDPRQREIREAAWLISRHIESDPSRWMEAAQWYRNVPIHLGRRIGSSLDYPEYGNPLESPDVYAPDPERERCAKENPHITRLMAAWAEATREFVLRAPRDRFHDLTVPQARRIALLIGLIFDRGFDGACLGFTVPWTSAGPASEGRGWAWAAVSQPRNSEFVLDLVRAICARLGLSTASSAGAMAEAIGSADESFDRITLDRHQICVLRVLNAKQGQRVFLADLEADCKNLGGPKGRATIAKVLNRLAENGLVEYDPRTKSGATILPKGVAWITRYAP